MGRVAQCGYVQIKIDNITYYAGPLAWFYMTGRWPKHTVDHENRLRNDNRWSNLREATRPENAGNTGLWKTNKSGYRGVSASKKGKYRASIKRDGKTYNLGDFACPKQAAKAYDGAAIGHYGLAFARLNFPEERDGHTA